MNHVRVINTASFFKSEQISRNITSMELLLYSFPPGCQVMAKKNQKTSQEEVISYSSLNIHVIRNTPVLLSSQTPELNTKKNFTKLHHLDEKTLAI